MKKQKNSKRKGKNPKVPPRFDNRLIDNRMGGMPDSFVATLEYSDVVKFTSTSSPYAGYVFRGNSMYDPDFSSTGHQPLYFDQFMQTYSHYLVKSVTITLQFIGLSSFCYVVPTSDPLSFGPNTPTFSEYPRSRVTAVGNAAIMPSRPVTAFFSTQAVLGLSPQQLTDRDYAGTATTNPSSIWYINLAAVSSDLSTNASMSAVVKISYTAVFYDRVVLTPSFTALNTSSSAALKRK
jgi:hypothetical protein